MRILIQSLNYAPEPTGTSKYSGEMAEWLAQRGHRVTVVAGTPHYPEWRVQDAYRGKKFRRRETLNGVDVRRVKHYVPDGKRVTTLRRIRLETSFTLRGLLHWVRLMFREPKYDIVIAVAPPLQDAAMPMVYSWSRRVPWVLHIQDFQVDAALQLSMLKPGLGRRAIIAAERWVMRRATAVSTITKRMHERALEKGVAPEKTFIFPNWGNFDEVHPDEPMNEFRAGTGAGPSDVLFMYAGNVGRKQGLDMLVEVADRLRARKDIKFAVVGSGAEYDVIRGMVDDRKVENFRLFPTQPFKLLGTILAAGDVQLVLQKPEAADLVMPSKVTNILAAGRPFIAQTARGTGLHEVALESGAALIVAPDDIDALERAILDLSVDALRRKKMGENGREYGEKHMAKERILADLETQLARIIESRT